MAEDKKTVAPTAPWLAGGTAAAPIAQIAPLPAPAGPATPDVPAPVVLTAAIAATKAADSAPSPELVDDVIVTVPKAFQLRLDNFTLKVFKAGVQRMERRMATHWYAIAHGVSIFEDK